MTEIRRRRAEPVPKDAPDRSELLARRCAEMADENRAENIEILCVSKLCSYTDYFIIASGHNQAQLRAIARDVEIAMGESGLNCMGREGFDMGHWILLDFGEVIMQIFDFDARNFYQLEELWADAPQLDWTPLPEAKPEDEE
ncbi:MAG: ribosome silencing factor [Planctomycetes bacterium]|nr:ribosome silencing factor [Planctomycetota bacterium]